MIVIENLENTENVEAIKKQPSGDFPGGAAVGNPPANVGDMGLMPGPGGSHMPWSS